MFDYIIVEILLSRSRYGVFGTFGSTIVGRAKCRVEELVSIDQDMIKYFRLAAAATSAISIVAAFGLVAIWVDGDNSRRKCRFKPRAKSFNAR